MFDIYWTYSRSAYWTLFQKCVLNVIPEVRIERYSSSAYWTLFQKCVLHTKFDIYVLLLFLKNIIVLKTNVCGSLCVLWPLHCFSFLHFSHCIVNPSIYGVWLPLCHFQTYPVYSELVILFLFLFASHVVLFIHIVLFCCFFCLCFSRVSTSTRVIVPFPRINLCQCRRLFIEYRKKKKLIRTKIFSLPGRYWISTNSNHAL